MAGRGGGGRDKVGASREGVEGGAWPATRARAGERPCWTARTSASWGGGGGAPRLMAVRCVRRLRPASTAAGAGARSAVPLACQRGPRRMTPAPPHRAWRWPPSPALAAFTLPCHRSRPPSLVSPAARLVAVSGRASPSG